MGRVDGDPAQVDGGAQRDEASLEPETVHKGGVLQRRAADREKSAATQGVQEYQTTSPSPSSATLPQISKIIDKQLGRIGWAQFTMIADLKLR